MATSTLFMSPMNAKKSAAKKRHPASELRREWQTSAELREAAAMLNEKVISLQELAERMDQQGMRSIHVDGVRKFPNAMKLINTYVKNVRKACIDREE